MFNYVKSVGCIIFLFTKPSSFSLIGKLTSVIVICWTLIRERQNSERYLIEMRCLGEASAACSILKLELQLSFLTLRLNASSIKFIC